MLVLAVVAPVILLYVPLMVVAGLPLQAAFRTCSRKSEVLVG